jgi:hypothetical protein
MGCLHDFERMPAAPAPWLFGPREQERIAAL